MNTARRKSALKIIGPVDVLVLDSRRGPCPACGGSFAWSLEAGNGGASFGDTFDHKPECPKLRCEHGVPWEQGCDACGEEEFRDRTDEDEDDDGADAAPEVE